jgi:sugar lactone lactonase YvrE
MMGRLSPAPWFVLLLLAALIPSCASNGGPSGIGPNGGTVTSANGNASVSIPAGALSQTTTITVALAANAPAGDIGAAYEFGPSGTSFGQPVTISISYDDTTLPPGVSEAALRLGKVVDNQWQTITNSVVDAAANLVTGTTSTFSTYGVVVGEAVIPLGVALFVSSQTGPTAPSILGYDEVTGTFLGVFAVGGSLTGPLGMTFGPDGNLYVANGSGQVLRYNVLTGTFMGVFASGGGLSGATNVMFGPDGNLYVTSFPRDQVLRYNGATGAFIDVFASGAELAMPRGLTFGPDGNLYVVSYDTSSVLRYAGATGAFMDVFVSARSGGLFTPNDLVFGPDGNLYVTGGTIPNNLGVFRYNGVTGAFMDRFASVGDNGPMDLAFGPDGNLYVVIQGLGDGVLRFNGTTGALIDAFVPPGSGGLSNPFGLAFSPRSRDADGDGVSDELDQCSNSQPGTIVDANGCSIAQ